MKNAVLCAFGGLCFLVVSPVLVPFIVYRVIRYKLTGEEIIGEDEFMQALKEKQA